MSYSAIVYYPDRERKTATQPFGTRGARLFNYQIDRGNSNPAPKKGGLTLADRVEIEIVAIAKGTNFIESQKWEAVAKEVVNQPEIEKLTSIGALKIFIPDAEITRNRSSDFSSIEDLQEIIDNSKDVDWLSLSLKIDQRADVSTMLANRLKEIEEEVAAMSQQLNSGATMPGLR
jgi:hypothetical protein